MPISSHVELIARRRLVRAFIYADLFTITLTRPGEITKTNTGGTKPGVSTPLSPQPCRLIQNFRRYSPGLVNAEAGDIPRYDYLVVGLHTMNIKKLDTFTWQGSHYEVMGVHPFRDESILAGVEFRGPKN